MITYLGNMSIGAALPGIGLALSVSLGDLEARLRALLAMQLNLGGIDFGLQLELALSIVANIKAAISVGLELPSISIQAELILQLILSLKVQIGIILQLNNLLLTAGLDAYSYDGRVDLLGSELSAELSSGLPSGGTGATHCNALVLVTSLAATWSAVGQILIT